MNEYQEVYKLILESEDPGVAMAARRTVYICGESFEDAMSKHGWLITVYEDVISSERVDPLLVRFVLNNVRGFKSSASTV